MSSYLRSGIFCLSVFLAGCSSSLPEEVVMAYEQLPERIDFNFHIRPILSDRCFSCHGPDENARKAELRLDLEEKAFARLASGDGYAFIAKHPHRSVAVERLLSDDPERMMPPPDANLSLTNEEKAIIVKWVEQGAEWKEHWAFIPPELPALPQPDAADQEAAHPIDLFIYRALENNGLLPSPPAGKERLLRRVYMDLTGLPPSIEDMDAFLADDSPEAYEKVVDRLLASDANAERLAMDWMDLARYADSHGMHADGYRMMWPWRDWVIRAFKENMPYDQFVTHQLAGDLLPNASLDQKLATAFNRNHPMTAEGGVIDEEFRLQYVFDRAETVATAFLGLTLNCARCHDHKFDPVSQNEYYRFTAFFNNVKELGMTGDDGNYGPMLLLPPPGTEEKLEQLKTTLGARESEYAQKRSELAKVAELIQRLPATYRPPQPAGYFPLDRIREKQEETIVDGNPKSTSPGLPKLVEGKVGKALEFTGNYDELYLKGVGLFELHQPFSAGLWINTTKKEAGKTQVLLGTAGDKNNFWRGWDFYLDDQNRLNLRLIHSLPHNYLHLQTLDSIGLRSWTHLAFSYDGSGKAAGVQLYINGKKAQAKVRYDQLYKSILPVTNGAHLADPARAIRVAKSYRSFTGESGVFKGMLDEIRCYNTELSPVDMAIIGGQKTVAEFNAGQDIYQPLLKEHYILRDNALKDLKANLRNLKEQQVALMEEIPEVMVMEEMATPRATFVYHRGNYEAPKHEVALGTPEKVLPFPEDLPKNRQGLAQWLFHAQNPLTARVTVNRYWQMLFGIGLVETPQDFGVQGKLPSHPELLDWLAIYFRESQWNVKALLKVMVMSDTYRQSSEVSEELIRKDPQNQWLARGPSYRLPAEMIRDNALAASGLLVDHIGGESVRPYQPEGLWIEKGNFSHQLLTYKVTRGDSLYRRSLYTFMKRTSPPPFMTTFDAPNRDVCTVRRENTNTPLQALILLNDPQFVEASRALAECMQTKGGEALEGQLVFAFRRVTGRHPKPKELTLFQELYQKQLTHYRQHPAEARELLSVGDYGGDPGLDPGNTAALAIVANTMFNHGDAYTKR